MTDQVKSSYLPQSCWQSSYLIFVINVDKAQSQNQDQHVQKNKNDTHDASMSLPSPIITTITGEKGEIAELMNDKSYNSNPENKREE